MSVPSVYPLSSSFRLVACVQGHVSGVNEAMIRKTFTQWEPLVDVVIPATRYNGVSPGPRQVFMALIARKSCGALLIDVGVNRRSCPVVSPLVQCPRQTQ